MYLVALAFAGCAGPVDSDTADTDVAAAGVCTEPVELDCVDELLQDLSLQDDKTSNGAVETTAEGDDFVTTVDASAGGFGNETKNAWTYVRFTATGAEKVEIDDETALVSMDWHIAARRFILRLNGGSSGPSCVGASAFFEKDYSELTSVPEGLEFVSDAYYTHSCDLINDSSGLEGSPQVALAPWWEYPGCVKTTDVPFLIQLDDGSVLRFAVEQYYETGQETCNASGNPGQGGGAFVWRWAWVDAP